MRNNRIYPRPNARLAFAEVPRVLSEMASLIHSTPYLSLAPRGDGHPVLVLPGFGGSDRSTHVLRRFLTSVNYAASPWNLGTNLGPAMADLPTQLARRLDEVFIENGDRKISLVGWSLGGVYARILAHRYPDKIRQVITLGSPFAGNPTSTSVYPIARRMGAVPSEHSPNNNLRLLAGTPLPGIPSTAIFSKTDGIVPWQIASQEPTDIAENIEVYSSHIGLGFNPTVLFATADRLATVEGNWKPFERRGWKSVAYGPANLESNDTGMTKH